MGGAEDALCVEEVEDKKEDNTGGDEDLRGDCDLRVGEAIRPYDSENAGGDSGHAETECNG